MSGRADDSVPRTAQDIEHIPGLADPEPSDGTVRPRQFSDRRLGTLQVAAPGEHRLGEFFDCHVHLHNTVLTRVQSGRRKEYAWGFAAIVAAHRATGVSCLLLPASFTPSLATRHAGQAMSGSDPVTSIPPPQLSLGKVRRAQASTTAAALSR